MKTILKINGMHCTSCKDLIEEVCREVSGVTECMADFKTGKVVVEHTEKLDINKIKKEIVGLGLYKVEF